MAKGIQAVGALDDARQQRAFREAELARVLAEIGLRRLAEPVN